MSFFSEKIKSKNQKINIPLLEEKGIELWVKREDKIHKYVSGNKFRKLKYNIAEALKTNKKILTFGGAFSNHIVATSVACNMFKIKSIGVIRGEELKKDLNKLLLENNTIRVAYENDMHFEFVTRSDYKNKKDLKFLNKLYDKYGDFYLVPEGGTNNLAVKGCEEIITTLDEKFDYICCPVGTGGTIAGLINSCNINQKVLGFEVLKGDFLKSEIEKLTNKKRYNWNLIKSYNFGGYAKYNSELIFFINQIKRQTKLQLDPIYTSKMFYGIIDMIKNNFFKKRSKILAIHTGGLQGILGVNKQLTKRKLEKINY